MLRSSRHPYQATSVPQPHFRNPWVEKPESSTNSSCGSRRSQTAKNIIPQPTAEWLLPKGQTFSHQGPLLNQQPQPVVVQSRGPGSAVSTIHESSGAASSTGGIGSCGGQCVACETFCYYCLQFSRPLPSAILRLLWLLRRVIKLERLTRLNEDIPDVSPYKFNFSVCDFPLTMPLAVLKGETSGMSSSNRVVFVAGILTGIALTIAGSVLHGSQRDGDLVVLMYIGVLLVLVCILLLSVHCCVRKNVKERKRALRLALMDGTRRGVHPSSDFMAIPVQDFATDQPFRNSFAETNLNEIEYPENPRRLINTMPNPSLHYQNRPVPSSRSSSSRMHTYDRRSHAPEVPDRQPYEWNRNSQQPGIHRSFR